MSTKEEFAQELDVQEEELSGVEGVLHTHAFVQDTEESVIQDDIHNMQGESY